MKYNYLRCVALVIAVTLFSNVLWSQTTSTTKYSGGSGKERDPYLISTSADLSSLSTTSADWDRHFELTGYIDATGANVTPIGNATTRFSGTFNGNGNVIANLNIKTSVSEDAGLFGWVGPPAGPYEEDPKIRNLGLINPVVEMDVTITIDPNDTVVIDPNDPNTIGGSDQNAINRTVFSAGSLVGFLQKGNLKKCFARGVGDSKVKGSPIAGGLVGEMRHGAKIVDCYASVNIESSDIAGGLVGVSRGTVTTSYSTCVITAGTRRGGLFGLNGLEFVPTDILWDKTIGEPVMCGGPLDPNDILGDFNCDDTLGKTTADMKEKETFSSRGWKFEKPWIIQEEPADYPRINTEGFQAMTLEFNIEPGQVVPFYTRNVNDPNSRGIININKALSQIEWDLTINETNQDQVFLRGPANVGSVGNVQFDLLTSSEPIDLTETQLNELLEGKWYIEVVEKLDEEIIFDPMAVLDQNCFIDPAIIVDPNGDLSLTNVLDSSGILKPIVLVDPNGTPEASCFVDPNIYVDSNCVLDPNGLLSVSCVFDPNNIEPNCSPDPNFIPLSCISIPNLNVDIDFDCFINPNCTIPKNDLLIPGCVLYPGCVVDPNNLSEVGVIISQNIRGQIVKLSNMTVAKIKVKADKDRSDPVVDTLTVSGQLYGNEAMIDVGDIANADSLSIEFTDANKSLLLISINLPTDMASKVNIINKQRYALKSSNKTSKIKTLLLDFKKNQYSMVLRNVNLSGLTTPFDMNLTFGIFNGTAALDRDEDIAIGKPLPLCLMSSVADDLRVYKAKGSSKSFNVQGGISAESPDMDLSGLAVEIFWGSHFNEVIDAGGFVKKGKGNRYSYKKSKTDAGNIQSMDIDFDKCVFKLSIKGATNLDLSEDVTFRINVLATNYDESDTFSF